MDNYQKFLESKAIFHPDAGIEVPLDKISKNLFPWQRQVTRWALRKGRAALFEDCGSGKSAQMAQWAKHIPGKVITFCPLAVAPQLVREFKKFGVDAVYSRFPVEDKITITNYDLLHRFNPDDYKAVILEESSIIKSFEGKFRNEIISRYRFTPYRLEASATPAPNDWMELGNHSEFLGNLTRVEMLATFFVHDGGDTAKWRLKKHAEKDFWKWVSSFAIMMRKPSDLGFPNDGFDLPELRIHEIVVDAEDPTPEQLFELGTLFPTPAKTLMERRKARSATVEDRAQMVADIVATKPNEQWIIWTNLNKESQAATKLIPGAVEITGSDSLEYKEKTALEFAEGKIKTLVTKSLIFGHGMNFQSCHNEAFLGLSDSWEQWYQAVRRCWRFGQKFPVDCYVVTSSLEGEVVKNIKRKEADAQTMAEEMVNQMHELNRKDLRGQTRKQDEYSPTLDMKIPRWL